MPTLGTFMDLLSLGSLTRNLFGSGPVKKGFLYIVESIIGIGERGLGGETQDTPLRAKAQW